MNILNAYYTQDLKQYLLQNPELTTEWHFPGQQYTGPGTHIVTRLLRGDIPSNKTDFVTMLHDIDYMGTSTPLSSDIRAIRNSDYSVQGLATKMGLGLRSMLDALPFVNLKFNKPSSVGKSLMMYVLTSPLYRPLFDKYQIEPTQYLGFDIR